MQITAGFFIYLENAFHFSIPIKCDLKKAFFSILYWYVHTLIFSAHWHYKDKRLVCFFSFLPWLLFYLSLFIAKKTKLIFILLGTYLDSLGLPLLKKKKLVWFHQENQNPAVLHSSLIQSSVQVCEPASSQQRKIWLISAQIFGKNTVLRRILIVHMTLLLHIQWYYVF